MRKFKLRAWHTEDKVMVYDLNSLKLFAGVLQVDDYVVMQYTGTKDRSGKEIYEGDIVEWGNIDSFSLVDHEMSGRRGTIKWWPLECSFRCMLEEGDRGYSMIYAPTTFEIIGNIYES